MGVAGGLWRWQVVGGGGRWSLGVVGGWWEWHMVGERGVAGGMIVESERQECQPGQW